MKTSTLVFVGVGIKFFSHTTQESLVHITDASKVYYLVNEPATVEWIKRLNNSAESLDELYYSCDTRIESYNVISKKLIDATNTHDNICVVMYGHPLVLNLPTKLTIDYINKNNLEINVLSLPGVSSESVMYCDLRIDPGVGGVQSYESTDLLLHNKSIEPSSHLILWQASSIGCIGSISNYDNSKGLALLKDYLLNYYPDEHEVCLYEASQYPHKNPNIRYTTIKLLDKTDISSLETLYIKPIQNQQEARKLFA